MSNPLLLRGSRAAAALIGRRRAGGTDGLPGVRPAVQRRFIIDTSYSTHFMDFKGSSIPSSMKKLVVTKLSQDFREAVTVRTVPVPTPGDAELLVRNRFVGINASDINYSAGRYDPSVKPPFGAGFEGIGEVVGLGLSASSRYTVGDTVAYFGSGGAFAEYTVIPAKEGVPVPCVKPEFLTLLVSGATAYIALKRLGDLANGETVLVTAAAGGTGQFAVQFAKRAGCHVIGTCSSDEKAGFLKSIGCDRPINYSTEDLAKTLRKEYPKGVDVVYESVGGSVLELAVNSLANKGRLIVIGFISGYQTASGIAPFKGGTLPVKLLQKSASMRGFFLPHFIGDYKEALSSMMQMFAKGELVCEVDCGDMAEEGRFVGLESIFRAVDYMYAGRNLGKVVVEVAPPTADKSKL
ncbi:PREDICTED: zinc-binding alcohol dehydrogenase domain-containing protein 2 [Cyprinodon variegatus]|uniref:15-oxoprostaglandin 13-reductase n=1 Tax=Cyprinodon variegatus TaxID=28743 RepID=A0A3Q2GN59_CYPVA|nr:PREDICTED: zinc-binding alcohol dehydrogenase domain-containing protein 2 [Cyprinodon variegatus]